MLYQKSEPNLFYSETHFTQGVNSNPDMVISWPLNTFCINLVDKLNMEADHSLQEHFFITVIDDVLSFRNI